MLSGLGPGPSVPILGEVKPLLVDARLLGTLAGPQRNRLVNRFMFLLYNYGFPLIYDKLNTSLL